MYKIIDCKCEHSKENMQYLINLQNSIKIDGIKNTGLRGFEFDNNIYMIVLAEAVLNYNDTEYVFALSGEKRCVLLAHNYPYRHEIILNFTDARGRERERIIEVHEIYYNADDYNVYKVKYTKAGKKYSVLIGTIRSE